MSDMEVERDPVVRTALQRLPVPPHRDDFWGRLDAALDAEAPIQPVPRDGRSVFVASPDDAGTPDTDAVSTSAAPEPDPALALVPRALRRTSNGVLLAVAAAAAVVVTLAGTTLIDERSGTNGGTSDEVAQQSAALDDLVDDAHPDDGTPAALSDEGETASSKAVLAFVADLDTGDGASAWNAMGPSSQAHFGSQAAFESEMGSLAEGYGDWSAAEPEDVLVTPVLSTEHGTIAVVTLVGTVTEDGAEHRRADAFPVRLVEGKAEVEPFAVAGAIESVVPEADPADGEPATVAPDDELVVVVPSDVDAPVLRLDDGEALVCGVAAGSELTDLEGSSGQRCSYLPPDGIAPGAHTLTMAIVGSDGASISAGSVLFDAA